MLDQLRWLGQRVEPEEAAARPIDGFSAAHLSEVPITSTGSVRAFRMASARAVWLLANPTHHGTGDVSQGGGHARE